MPAPPRSPDVALPRRPRRRSSWTALVFGTLAAVSGSATMLTLAFLSGPGHLATTPPSPGWIGAPVDAAGATRLVRRTLLSLDDANRTSNYSVFRDTAADAFRVRHAPVDLARIFAVVARLDLGAAATAMPEWSGPPALDARGLLRLAGSLPAPSQRIVFDLLFQSVGGDWRLFGVSVRAEQPEPGA